MSEDLRRPSDWDQPVRIPPLPGPIERVMVPFDGSHAGELALAYADLVAAQVDAEIIVVVAFDPPITVRRRGILMVEHLRTELESEARELAEESVTLLTERGRRARGVIVRGDVVDAILEAAESEHAELLILGRRGLAAELSASGHHGGVSEKVTHRASIPVLLVG